MMADVPRGMEILDLVCARDGHAPMERAQAEAFHTYWIADKARLNASPADDAWLQAAQSLAKQEVRNRRGEPAAFPDRYAICCERFAHAENVLAMRRDYPIQMERRFLKARATSRARHASKPERDEAIQFMKRLQSLHDATNAASDGGYGKKRV